MLALEQIEAPRTHDITFLVELLDQHRIEMPATLVESEWLGPWAVTMRYDDIEEVLDRTGALDAALAATEWASGRIDGHR